MEQCCLGVGMLWNYATTYLLWDLVCGIWFLGVLSTSSWSSASVVLAVGVGRLLNEKLKPRFLNESAQWNSVWPCFAGLWGRGSLNRTWWGDFTSCLEWYNAPNPPPKLCSGVFFLLCKSKLRQKEHVRAFEITWCCQENSSQLYLSVPQ